jgi:hypothetical protein
MRRGHRRSPWRALRHNLFICGLSLAIALVGSVATFLVPEDEAHTFLRTSAATPAEKAGSTSSFGVLSKVVREATNGSDPDDAAAPAASGNDASEDAPEASADAEPAQDDAVEAASAEEGGSGALIAAALTEAPIVLQEVQPEAAATVVSSSRFSTATSATVSAARTQAAVSTVEALKPGDRITVPVTFYYCEETTGGQRRGDGGGFCGVMRNGDVVHPGAAACDVAYLGQRFIIEGDPTGRTYVCADTGGGVHRQHRDIWFLSNSEGWAWQAAVGRTAVIDILP